MLSEQIEGLGKAFRDSYILRIFIECLPIDLLRGLKVLLPLKDVRLVKKQINIFRTLRQ